MRWTVMRSMVWVQARASAFLRAMTIRLIATALAVAAAVLAGCSSGSSSGRTSTFAKIERPAQVAVPDVRGQAIAQATARLKDAQLRWRVHRRYGNQPAGSILGVDPAAGAKVAPGTEVALVVSRGPAPQPVATPSAPP